MGEGEWQFCSLCLHSLHTGSFSVAFPGDSNTIPTKFNDTGGEGESSGRRESIPRTDRGSLENGGDTL